MDGASTRPNELIMAAGDWSAIWETLARALLFQASLLDIVFVNRTSYLQQARMNAARMTTGLARLSEEELEKFNWTRETI